MHKYFRRGFMILALIYVILLQPAFAQESGTYGDGLSCIQIHLSRYTI